jgi:crotonobetainyl-CoA:carnitine CoA-transferase CaiB-like acyl-CoA transferase
MLPVTFDGERAAPRRGIPGVGADTRSVLQQIDLSDAEIAELFGDKIVADAAPVDGSLTDRKAVAISG